MPRKSRKNVGLIGLGIIGSRVAAGLRAAGFHVFVWNRTAKPAPNFVGSPAELAELCEIIQLFVADAQALFDVVEQMKDVLTPQHVIVCNATVGPEATIEAARMVEETGAHFLDAPFTGSKAASEKRALVYYIGGDEATFLRARPVLEATSKAIVRIGGVGHAATIKVVTNMIAAVSIQTLGEALAIVQKAGLDPEVLAAALEQNACRSATMEMKLPKMIAGDYDPHFSLKHMFKDVQLGIHVANALDIEIPATTVTAGVMYGALNQGWGDLDFSALYKIYDPQSADAPLGELHGGMVQLEDLDPREVHYPETTVPAPPRPTAEAASSSEPAEIVAENLATLVEGNGELAAKTAWPAMEATPPPLSELVLAPIAPEPPAGSVVLNVPAPEPAHENNAAALALKPVEIVPAPVAEIVKSSTLNPPEVAPPSAVAESQPDRVLNSAIRVVDAPTSPEPAHLAASPAAEQNGGAAVVPNRAFPDEATSAQKPFNFVKRWFVARTGS